MKIYDYKLAPNPRRVRVFLAEKGLNVPLEEVDIFKGINRQPEFLKKNSLGGIPVLELDDGRHLAESVAICRYFELLHPEPALFGKGAFEQATVEMWNRRMELALFVPVGMVWGHSHELTRARIKQIPEMGEAVAQGCRAALRLARSRARGQEFYRRRQILNRGYHRDGRHRLRQVQQYFDSAGAEESRAMASGGLVAAECGRISSDP